MKPVISIGNQDFRSIRENHNFYVDKSDFIREWWENQDTVTLITRPRRFGKTLNMSMLENFFSIQNEKREDLFEGLAILEDQKYRALQGSFPVIFLSFAKDADGLSPGGSVEVSYSSKSMGTANDNAIYIQKAYIRTEDKKNYVYIRDKKTKRLKKQYVKVGKTMNGQYVEIISGLTDEDNIAFPYGKNLREGVKTKISEDDSEMIY